MLALARNAGGLWIAVGTVARHGGRRRRRIRVGGPRRRPRARTFRRRDRPPLNAFPRERDALTGSPRSRVRRHRQGVPLAFYSPIRRPTCAESSTCSFPHPGRRSHLPRDDDPVAAGARRVAFRRQRPGQRLDDARRLPGVHRCASPSASRCSSCRWSALLPRAFPGAINIPDRDYWLAPERREDTLGLPDRHGRARWARFSRCSSQRSTRCHTGGERLRAAAPARNAFVHPARRRSARRWSSGSPR